MTKKTSTPAKAKTTPKTEKVTAEKVTDTVVKKKVKSGNPALVGDKALQVNSGDNSQYLGHGLELMRLPPINADNEDEIINRIDEYFQLCEKWDVKPAVSGLAMALGIDRRRLWEIKTDYEGRNVKMTARARDSIKKAYIFLENLWENYMLNYKIHPTAGIFLAKNNFGYKDEQTYNLVPNNPLGDTTDITAAQSKYQDALPDDIVVDE